MALYKQNNMALYKELGAFVSEKFEWNGFVVGINIVHKKCPLWLKYVWYKWTVRCPQKVPSVAQIHLV
jgi:hypothetical protein